MNLFEATDEQILQAMDASSFTPVQVDLPTDTTDEDDDQTIKGNEQPTEVIEPGDAGTDVDAEGDNSNENNEADATKDTPPKPDEEAVEQDGNEYKTQLDRLFSPFVANGKELKVDNVDDAIRLMQMGAGFNKKMAALKPHLKTVKILENNGIKDEETLSFLIDVFKREPKAISKLLADSNIDPLNLAPSNDYTPNTYSVSDSELDLNSALDDLRDSKHFPQLLDVVVNKLDSKSRELLISSPDNFSVLHEQMANGIYDRVMSEVEIQRTLGKLKGLSDIEAYQMVGSQLHAKGAFNTAKVTPPVTDSAKPTNPSADESKLKSRKLAASPTKSSPGKKTAQVDFNPLTASDEEIMKMTIDKFL